MLMRTKMPQPSLAVKAAWKTCEVNKSSPIEFVKDRLSYFNNSQRIEIKKLIKSISKKTRKNFRRKIKSKFSKGSWQSINKIELVHSHQRLPVFKIIKDILKALCGREVNPIRVAILQQKGKAARYICYDGQHTIIVFYLLGYKTVPVEYSIVENLAEVRVLFRSANGKGIHGKISHTENHRQEVLRFVEDRIRDKLAQLANQVQQLLIRNCMAMDGKGKLLNTISRVKELYDLKIIKQQQMYIDCYKHRIGRLIFTTSYPGMGSLESRFYYVMITAGYSVKEINKITDYLYDMEGTTTAFPTSAFWNNVADHAGNKEGETALRFLQYEYREYRNLEDYGITL